MHIFRASSQSKRIHVDVGYAVRGLGLQRHGNLQVSAIRCFSKATAVEESKTAPGVYVANIEGRQNSSPILLGLADYFERHLSSVGFFQPVYMSVWLIPVCEASNAYAAFGFAPAHPMLLAGIW